MILEGAQESFEPINVIIKGKCMGADPSGTQSTEQRQSTMVHKNIDPRHVKTEQSVPGVSALSLGSSAGLPSTQPSRCPRYFMEQEGEWLLICPSSSASLLLLLLPFAIAHGLRCLLLATSGLHGSQLCVNSSLPGCVFLNTGTMFS